MSLCQTALWHSKKAACPSPSLSCCPTLPLNLHSGVFHASPGASWLHRSQLSERTEKPCNHGLLAVGSMGPTSIQTLTLLTQHGEKLWMKHLRGCLQIDFFSPLMWICNSGYGEWTQTLFKNCFFGGVYLKQTEVAEKSLCFSEKLDSSTASSGLYLLFDGCRAELYIWHMFWMSHSFSSVDVGEERKRPSCVYPDCNMWSHRQQLCVWQRAGQQSIYSAGQSLKHHTCRKADVSCSVM